MDDSVSEKSLDSTPKDKTAEPEKNDAPSGSLDSLKWLIPQATVYFIIAGFIIQSAHEDLLGVPIYTRDPQSYINSAAEFFRDIIINLIDAVFKFSVVEVIATHPWVFALAGFTTIVVVLCHWYSRLHLQSVWVAEFAAASVIILVVFRLAAIDVPITRINGLVAPGPDRCWSLVPHIPHAQNNDSGSSQSSSSTDSNVCSAIQHSTGYDRRAWQQSQQVAGAIICSRTAGNSFVIPPQVEDSDACIAIAQRAVEADKSLANRHWEVARDALQNEREAQRRRASDEAYADMFAALIACGLAVTVRRFSASSLISAPALAIALLSTLTIPYVYGKTALSQNFDYGELRIGATLNGKYMADGVVVTDAGPDSPNNSLIGTTPGLLNGFVIQRDGKASELLTLRNYKCGEGGTANLVTLSSVEGSQVLSFDQINRTDVIAWVLENQQDCTPKSGGQ